MSTAGARVRWIVAGVGVAAIAAICVYSIALRRRYFGVMAEGHLMWLTGDALRWTTTWYQEGAANLWFAMYDVGSIERATFNVRGLYVSYPPGALLPVHLLVVLTGNAPSLSMVMGYNLFAQMVTAVCLAALAFRATASARLSLRWASAVLAAALYTLLPGQLFFHQQVYFADQAVLPLIALTVLLADVRREASGGAHRLLSVVLFVLAVLGTLTDWNYVLVAFALFCWTAFEHRRSWRDAAAVSAPFWAGTALALVLFLAQLAAIGGFAKLYQQFLLRAALSPAGQREYGAFHPTFWGHHIPVNLGRPAAAAVLVALGAWAVLAVVAVRRTRSSERAPRDPALDRLFFLLTVIVLPSFAYVYLLRNHSAVHDFSTMKFALVLALFPYSALPAATGAFVVRRWPHAAWARDAVLVAGLVLGTAHVMIIHRGWRGPFRSVNTAQMALRESLRRATTYDDVIFSPTFENGAIPPMHFVAAMKHVYRVTTLADVDARLRPVDGPYRVNLLFTADPECPGARERVAALLPPDAPLTTVPLAEGATLLRLDRAAWERVRAQVALDRPLCGSDPQADAVPAP